MGQYYKPCFLDHNLKDRRRVIKYACSHDYDNGLKLMEHSYVGNDFVNRVLTELATMPQRFVWAGDYADKEADSGKTLYSLAAPDQGAAKIPFLAPVQNYRTLFRYAVNHSRAEYVRLNGQPKDVRGLQICPLPLLTAEGNGQGNGDYEGTGMKFVGRWAGDLIWVTQVKRFVPRGYTEIKPVFKEARGTYPKIPAKPSSARRLRPDVLVTA